MATLVLTAVGAAIGGLIGAFIGGEIDREVLFKPKGRAGPRLSELKLQTSSYGTPIQRIFGTIRVAGCVIWSTDLIESRSTSSTGKGQPSTPLTVIRRRLRSRCRGGRSRRSGASGRMASCCAARRAISRPRPAFGSIMVTRRRRWIR